MGEWLKAVAMTANDKRPNVVTWGGALAPVSRSAKVMVFVALSVATLACAFAQLGLIGLGDLETGMTYAVVQLVWVALGALLFGPIRGALLGLIAGGSLLVHSYVQPLDFFESYFITPLSSCALLAVAGLAMGLVFALLLRKPRSQAVRLVAICVTCCLGAALTVFAFHASVVHEVATQPVFEGVPAGVANSLGALWAQVLLDAVLMIAVCVAADAVVRYFMRPPVQRSMRVAFRGWLFLIVLVVFMVTAGAGYYVVTIQEEQAANERMQSELVYLCNQIEEHEHRIEAFSELLDQAAQEQGGGIDNASLNRFRQSLSLDNLLEGYSEEYDGMVAVLRNGMVILSDTEEIPYGAHIDSMFGIGILETFSAAAESNQMLKFATTTDEVDEAGDEKVISLQSTYLCVAKTGEYYVMIMQPASMVFADRAGVMIWLTVSALVLLLAVFAASSRLLGRVVADPIDATNRVLARIEEGDLKARSHERSSKEFASLSAGVNATVSALERKIAEAKEGIARELEAARAIQEAALPRTFPPYPDILRFDLYASMQPAKQVGGDFYDFFLIGEDCDARKGKLGFVIADVSGKGVPASLFMMAAKTAIRGYAESGVELGEAFENANRKLCAGNDAAMFVTAFAGVLDYETGHLTYVNAGHNAPLLWRGGAWQALKQRSGLPLGLFDGMSYKSHECDCGIGDTLFLYTDGVTEAMDVDENLYGFERLESLLASHFDLHPRQLIELVRRDVDQFAKGAEQADDITMLALEYGVPPEVTAMLVVPADDDQLPRVTEFVHTELDRRLCPLRAQRQLDIALEELFVNISHYAYPQATPDEPGMVRVSYTYSAEPPSITVELADEGVAFDPLAKPDAVTPKSIEEVPIGGLGILMAKKSVDALTYERIDNTNVVSITKKW